MPISDAYAFDKRPSLSSDNPLGFPHLINLEKYAQTNQNKSNTELRLADGIVTLLYNYKPEALDQFLNVDSTKFSFLYTGAGGVQWSIFRDDDRVWCGKNGTGKPREYYDVSIGFRMKRTGIWKPICVDGNTFFERDETNAALVETLGGKLAHEMIEKELWKAVDGQIDTTFSD